ncbi:hypothetical protein [Streptomyces iconiensis]|uniref:Uncharacterized protein n=1 Tax=Streptomyces iconiensis TaxID=1384038 RepID=A0ABT6ZZW2_9ACTN|nr:hypothetical protein [Streptomyces iconiensis]MDJ1134616.1 hypothetical protein [Streptomyces iconiensis]
MSVAADTRAEAGVGGEPGAGDAPVAGDGASPDVGADRSAGPAADRGGHKGPARTRLRGWTVSWTAGVAQALGGALLLITEFVREDVAGLGQKVRDASQLPGYADGFPRMQASLGEQWWFRLAGDLRDALSFDEPRAALWAAVCAALVVRLNREGPPRTQCFLSLMGALYCLVATASAVPYLALAGAALPFALVLAAVTLAVATRVGQHGLTGEPLTGDSLPGDSLGEEPLSAPGEGPAPTGGEDPSPEPDKAP